MDTPTTISTTPLRARACPHCGVETFQDGPYCWRCRPDHICRRCYTALAVPGKAHQLCADCAELEEQIADECRRDAEREPGYAMPGDGWYD